MTHANALDAMKADAKACNARMRGNLGVGSHTAQKPSKPKRILAPDATQRILATVSDTPMTTAQIAAQSGVCINTVRRACRRLSYTGKIEKCEVVVMGRARIRTYRRAGE